MKELGEQADANRAGIKALKAALPGVFAAYSRESISYRLTIAQEKAPYPTCRPKRLDTKPAQP